MISPNVIAEHIPTEDCEANLPIVLHAPPYVEAFEYFMLDNLLDDLVQGPTNLRGPIGRTFTF